MNTNINDLKTFDLYKLYEYLDSKNPEGMSSFFKSNKDHYRLLAYFSTLFNDCLIADIGSHLGHSALALSCNELNTVLSYDISDRVLPCIRKRKNIKFYTNHFNDSIIDIFKCKLIFLDTNHEGIHEHRLFNDLKHINWKGIFIIDDIWELQGVRDFWNGLQFRKFDLTKYGHITGTGVVDFTEELNIIDE